jgi:hypothetical protein
LSLAAAVVAVMQGCGPVVSREEQEEPVVLAEERPEAMAPLPHVVAPMVADLADSPAPKWREAPVVH